MSMYRSPHRKQRFRQSGDIKLPIGHRRGENRPSGGGEPGKAFKDPSGGWHTIPRKTRSKKKQR